MPLIITQDDKMISNDLRVDLYVCTFGKGSGRKKLPMVSENPEKICATKSQFPLNQ